MTAVIQWLPDVPSDIRTAIEFHLVRWLPVLPTWCHRIIVNWDFELAAEGDLQTVVHYEYRCVHFTIGPGFLNREVAGRSTAVLHEYMHVMLAPMCNAHRDLLVLLQEKVPDLYTLANEQYRHAMESVVVDLGRTISGSQGC